MCPPERFSYYKSSSKLVLCYKKDWATLLHFIYFCYLLLVTIYLITKLLLPLISVLAENTLLKTAYHFLLLLVGFGTLTYRKDYDTSPILVGHQAPPPSLSNSDLGGGARGCPLAASPLPPLGPMRPNNLRGGSGNPPVLRNISDNPRNHSGVTNIVVQYINLHASTI